MFYVPGGDLFGGEKLTRLKKVDLSTCPCPQNEIE
jgi:hypothetical protein